MHTARTKALGYTQGPKKKQRRIDECITSSRAYPTYFPHWPYALPGDYKEDSVVCDVAILIRCAAALRCVLETTEAVHLPFTCMPSSTDMFSPPRNRFHYFHRHAVLPEPPKGLDWPELFTRLNLQPIGLLFEHGFFAQGIMPKAFSDKEYELLICQAGDLAKGTSRFMHRSSKHRKYTSSHGWLEPQEVNEYIYVTLCCFQRMFKVMSMWTKSHPSNAVAACLAVGKVVFESWFGAWGTGKRMPGVWYARMDDGPREGHPDFRWTNRQLDFYHRDDQWQSIEYNDISNIDNITWAAMRQVIETAIVPIVAQNGLEIEYGITDMIVAHHREMIVYRRVKGHAKNWAVHCGPRPAKPSDYTEQLLQAITKVESDFIEKSQLVASESDDVPSEGYSGSPGNESSEMTPEQAKFIDDLFTFNSDSLNAWCAGELPLEELIAN